MRKLSDFVDDHSATIIFVAMMAFGILLFIYCAHELYKGW